MIVKKSECTGCFACANKCPKQCIKMEEDSNGYIYPVINELECINCGLCKKTCPSINKVKFLHSEKCFNMYSKNDKIRETSTSGGFATIASQYIINENGIIYGAAFVGNNTLVKHIRVDNKQDLSKLQGSKYVHSYIENSYQFAEKDLKNNKKVLFIGTPCQIAGLKNFLGKDYENLYTIDLICHGVPSQKYLREEIKSLTKENIDNIAFRTLDGPILRLFSNNKLIIEKTCKESVYFYGFEKNYLLRENCFNCLYAKHERCSDITIGDFWGLNANNSKIYDDEKKGFSAVMPITEKGYELVEKCKRYMEIEERSIEEIIDKNPQFTNTVKKPFNYEKIKKIYINKGYKKMGNSYCKWVRIRLKMKNIKIIYKTYNTFIKGKIHHQ